MTQAEKLEIEEGQQAVSKGYYFSKSLVIVVISLFIITIVGLIIGISVIESSQNTCKSQLSALQIATSQTTSTSTTTTTSNNFL